MARLTVGICFLNEREELIRTLQSLRDSAGDAVDVLLVNDGSGNDFDYSAVAREFRCRYHVNPRRIGTSQCRNFVVDRAETRDVLLLDAHVRFLSSDWWKRIGEALDDDPRALYCVRVPALGPDGQRTGAADGLGASLRFDNAGDYRFLRPRWNHERRAQGTVETVPCVLGGAYVLRREFFQHIAGYLGHRMWGAEEPFVSIKAWLAGGCCKLLDNVAIGHIYRNAEQRPFPLRSSDEMFNKMVMVATVFPESQFEFYRDLFARDTVAFPRAARRLHEARGFLLALRRHLQSKVFVRSFQDVLELNASFEQGEKIELPAG